MNEVVAPLKPRPLVPKRLVATRSDQAFLPAALEILETPPSPVGMALLVITCALAAAVLTWAYLGKIDIFAVANGKIRPTGQIKTVEPLEPGRVRSILVADGMPVKAGQVLLTLDPTQAMADAAGLESNLASYRAEAIRRRAAIDAARQPDTAPLPALDWPADIPAPVREREARVLQNDVASMRAALAALEAQAGEKLAERNRLGATTAAEETLIHTLQERVAMRNSLVAANAGTRANLIDAMQTLQAEQATLAADKGWLGEAEAAIKTFAANENKTRETFISDNAQKLADAERQADDYAQRLVKAKAAIDHMTLTSPADGTVQSLTATTVGQVLTSGQQVMRIVPAKVPLEIEAYVENKDIGFVHEGQDAIVKIESFPFTRYGTLIGHVTRIARDSIPAADAQRSEGDPTQLAPRNPNGTGASQTQDLVYPVIISLSAAAVEADGETVPLSPGMTVSTEIRTGQRRMIDYVFAPIVEVGSEAMRER